MQKTETIYFWSVTDLETGDSLSPDGWGDEWESRTDDADAIRERAAKFHGLPVERIAAYVYTTIQKH